MDYLRELYRDGVSELCPRSTSFASGSELTKIHMRLYNKIEMFDLVHNHWKSEFESRGTTKRKTELRKLVQKTFREASNQEKERWMKAMKAKRDW